MSPGLLSGRVAARKLVVVAESCQGCLDYNTPADSQAVIEQDRPREVPQRATRVAWSYWRVGGIAMAGDLSLGVRAALIQD